MNSPDVALPGVLLGCLLASTPGPAAAQVPTLEPAAAPTSVRAEALALLESYQDAFSDRDVKGFAAHVWLSFAVDK